VTRRSAGSAVALVAVGLVMLAGCSSGSPGDITATGARVLQPAVQRVRDVASTRDYLALRAAVAQLKTLARQQERLGNVSSSREVAIENAADVLLEDASPSPTPTPSPTTTSPTPTPTPTPTTTSPTPTPTPTTTTSGGPLISASALAGNGDGG
jgi:outer membrane murein-binding lipoprotein Lpp